MVQEGVLVSGSAGPGNLPLGGDGSPVLPPTVSDPAPGLCVLKSYRERTRVT